MRRRGPRLAGPPIGPFVRTNSRVPNLPIVSRDGRDICTRHGKRDTHYLFPRCTRCGNAICSSLGCIAHRPGDRGRSKYDLCLDCVEVLNLPLYVDDKAVRPKISAQDVTLFRDRVRGTMPCGNCQERRNSRVIKEIKTPKKTYYTPAGLAARDPRPDIHDIQV